MERVRFSPRLDASSLYAAVTIDKRRKKAYNLTRMKYDAIVVGTGHAGIEAALALARTGFRTLILSISLDNVGYLACNPSIGGTAKVC